MFLLVATKPPIERRRRGGFEFTRNPLIVDASEDAAAMILSDTALAVKQLTAEEAEERKARDAERAARGPSPDAVDFGGDDAAELTTPAEFQVADLKARLRIVTAERDAARARVAELEGGAGETSSSGDDAADDDGEELGGEHDHTLNDGGPERLPRPSRRRKG
jgi:hypothetical protein